MTNIIEWLKGKKSYGIAALFVVLAGLHQLGYINDQTYQTILVLLGAGGIAALRAGQSNAAKGK